IDKGDNLETIINRLDEILCSSGIDPDYSSYNTACLTEYGPTATQSDFVSTISNFVCDFKSTYETFINTTYANFVTTTNNNIQSITLPGTTGCSSMPIPGGSTLQQILQIHSNRLCEISSAIDIASVDWDACFVVTNPPSNVYEGFAEVLRQICSIKNNIPSFPESFKVKLDGTDTTEGYLGNKIKSSGCVTINTITDVDNVKKLQFGLGFTPRIYNFDPNFFSVNNGTNDGCVQTINVSFIGSTGGGGVDLNCSSLDAIFSNNPSNVPALFYGKSGTGECITIDPCQARSALFSGYGDGQYIINIKSTEGSLCDKYTLIPFNGSYVLPPATGSTLGGIKVGSGLSILSDGTLSVTGTGGGGTGSVSYVGLDLPPDTFYISGSPVTGSGTLTGTFIPQDPHFILMGPASGSSNATPVWRKLVTADIDNNIVTLPKLQQIAQQTLLGNSTGSSGDVQEITIGANLTLSGGVLSAAGGGGGGGVTSVGLTSSDITVGGTSPITGSGTFTLTLPNINPNVGT